MDLKNKINLDYNEALKAKDKSKISTYRLILSAIKDLDIANRSGPNKKDTDDDDIEALPAPGDTTEGTGTDVHEVEVEDATKEDDDESFLFGDLAEQLGTLGDDE